MKNILKKGSKFFLSALVILNSFMNIITVHAEKTTTENKTTTDQTTETDKITTTDSDIDDDKFQDYKLSLMEKVTDTVKYKIEFTLTKDDKNEWKIDSLSDTDLEKLHGTYVE